ncbi:hypothetical protein JCM16303_005144 [Sporobolomyces ruberrimus]
MMVLLDIPSNVCSKGWWFSVVGGMLVVFCGAIIMTIRVNAIYDRNCYVLAFFVHLLCYPTSRRVFHIVPFSNAEVGAHELSRTSLAAFQLPAPIAQVTGFHGCIPANRRVQDEKISGSVWAAPLAFDSVILLLTVYRCFSLTSITGSCTRLVRKILSTGIFYFTVITTSNLVNVILYSLPSSSPTLRTFHSGASDGITSIMCSRLVLSLFSPDSMSFVSDRFLNKSLPSSSTSPAIPYLSTTGNEGIKSKGMGEGEGIELTASNRTRQQATRGIGRTRDGFFITPSRLEAMTEDLESSISSNRGGGGGGPFEEAFESSEGKKGGGERIAKCGMKLERETVIHT